MKKKKKSATDDIKININTANNPVTEGIKMKGKTKLRDKKKVKKKMMKKLRDINKR